MRYARSVAAGVVCVVALGLAPVQAGQLTLSWIDNSDNEDGFAIERRQGPASAYAEIARVGPNSAGYVDVALDDGVEYCYRVRAFNGAGYSDYSNEACAVTAATLVSLVVVRDGEGAGTVSSTPSGIACGSDCSEAYPSGTAVTLTAAPASGSTFGGWSGGGCTGTAPCLLTVSQNTVVTATFALLTPPTSDTGALPSSSATLRVRVRGAGTVSSAPAGIRCPDDCQEAYPTGTTVTLTAAPAPGARFAGWGGACQGQASACTVTLGGLTEVRAKFSRLRASF